MSTENKRSFWDTKEGTTGMVIGLGVFGFIGWGAYKLMPYIANLMENMFYAIAFGTAAIALFYVTVLDDTLRTRGWLAYQMLMRALTYSIIKFDPAGVLRIVQKRARERREEINEGRMQVNGQLKQISTIVDSFVKDEKELTNKIEFGRRNNSPAEDIQNYLARLGKVNDAKIRLTKSRDYTQGMYEQLSRAYKAVCTMDENIDFEISITEREYSGGAIMAKAWKNVAAALKGDGALDLLRNDTLAFMAEDYGNKLGQIDSFMEDSMKFINGAELQNGMYAEAGLKVLDELNKRDLNVISAKKELPAPAINPGVMMPGVSGAKVVDYQSIRKN